MRRATVAKGRILKGHKRRRRRLLYIRAACILRARPRVSLLRGEIFHSDFTQPRSTRNDNITARRKKSILEGSQCTWFPSFIGFLVMSCVHGWIMR